MENDWDSLFKKARMDLDPFYLLAMSYLNVEHNDMPTLSISFDIETGDYKMTVPKSLGGFVKKIHGGYKEMLFVLKHEMEHLLRMHIYRGYNLVSVSAMKKSIGHKGADSVCGIIADFLINTSLLSNGADKKLESEFVKIAVSTVDDLNYNIPWVDFYKYDGDPKEASLEDLFRFADRFDIGDEYAKRFKIPSFDVLDLRSYEDGSDDMERAQLDNSAKGLLVSMNDLKSKKGAGYTLGNDHIMLGDINVELYDIESFLGMIVNFTVTDEVIYTSRRPPRKPNSQHGVTRLSLAPRCAILLDSSGSISMKDYVEFFKILSTVASREGADIFTIVFDGGVSAAVKGIPESLEKTNGGTNFIPPISRAIEEGYETIVMLTDGYNFDEIPASLLGKAHIIFLIVPCGDYKKILSAVPIDKNNVFSIDIKKNTVVKVK